MIASRAYYNEFDPYAAQWLRNLIAAGHIAPGEVDTRSIEDVTAGDLLGFTQCHFFAGIGGWSRALRLAGWPDDRPVWTGSCPCQPFSQAGRGEGTDDQRHLWPAWFWLIRQCRPATIFGEQVEAAIAHGWLDAVSTDLEASGYAIAPIIVPAAGIGAPHIRHRLWWVADSMRTGRLPGTLGGIHRGEEGAGPRDGEPERRGATGELANASGARVRDRGRGPDVGAPQGTEGAGTERERVRDDARHVGDGSTRSTARRARLPYLADHPGEVVEHFRRTVGDPMPAGLPLRQSLELQGQRGGHEGRATEQPGGTPLAGFWSDADWIACRDGKARPVEPGTFPLAPRLPNHVGRLRAYGNAIVPEAAAEVIAAFLSLENPSFATIT